MASEKEIEDALDIIKTYGCGDFIILHCVSGYPTPIDQINLNTIKLLRSKFDCEVGLSDHTIGNLAAILSISLGVKVIEKHFTVDRSKGGPDAAFSLEPSELNTLVSELKKAYSALGNANFERREAEEPNIKFRRSIYAVKKINKGEKLNEQNIKRIRPGYGLSPKFYNSIKGKIVNKDISIGEPILEDYFDEEILPS
jgi:N-acetylneuraminate synthase